MALDMVSVFRPERFYRNLIMLVGVFFAMVMGNGAREAIFTIPFISAVAVPFLGLCLISAGNYGLNEVYDAYSDRFHPQKRMRSIPTGKVSWLQVSSAALFLYLAGFMVTAGTHNPFIMIGLLLLLASGIVYNVGPVRLKDVPYLDFMVEAINSPIRFFVGWYSVSPTRPVPAVLIVSVWLFGVFLAASKRLGEFRLFQNRVRAEQYRKSFHFYKEKTLLASMLVAIVVGLFLFGTFSIMYRSRVVFVFPLFIGWVLWYFALIYQKHTAVADPERLYENRPFFFYSLLTVSLFVYLFAQ